MTGGSGQDGPPTIQEIQGLIRGQKLSSAERNHAITHTYHRISEAIRAEFDAGPNLDWCGFAKWSSYTVGLNFEPDGNGARATEQAEMIMKLLPRIFGFLRPIVKKLLEKFIDVEDDLVAKALRGGNGTIFIEMASIFVHLLERMDRRQNIRIVNAERTIACLPGKLSRTFLVDRAKCSGRH